LTAEAAKNAESDSTAQLQTIYADWTDHADQKPKDWFLGLSRGSA